MTVAEVGIVQPTPDTGETVVPVTPPPGILDGDPSVGPRLPPRPDQGGGSGTARRGHS